MRTVLLILGNGPTKRITVYGFALRSHQAEREIIWCRFSRDDAEEIPGQVADRTLDADISLLQRVDYTIVDLARYRANHHGSQARRRAFMTQWAKLLDKINTGKIDLVILEELDIALDMEWIKTSDVIPLLSKEKTEQFIITGNYLPAGILGTANKLVEVWEREND